MAGTPPADTWLGDCDGCPCLSIPSTYVQADYQVNGFRPLNGGNTVSPNETVRYRHAVVTYERTGTYYAHGPREWVYDIDPESFAQSGGSPGGAAAALLTAVFPVNYLVNQPLLDSFSGSRLTTIEGDGSASYDPDTGWTGLGSFSAIPAVPEFLTTTVSQSHSTTATTYTGTVVSTVYNDDHYDGVTVTEVLTVVLSEPYYREDWFGFAQTLLDQITSPVQEVWAYNYDAAVRLGSTESGNFICAAFLSDVQARESASVVGQPWRVVLGYVGSPESPDCSTAGCRLLADRRAYVGTGNALVVRLAKSYLRAAATAQQRFVNNPNSADASVFSAWKEFGARVWANTDQLHASEEDSFLVIRGTGCNGLRAGDDYPADYDSEV
jgi:hypothetical protein